MTKRHSHKIPISDTKPEPSAPQADGAVAEAPGEPLPEPSGEPAVAESRAPSAEPGPSEPADSDRYLRLAAEYDNFRKRTAKERAELSGRAQGELVKLLIDPLDDLARVIAQGPGAQDAKTVLDAVEVVDKKMMKGLIAAGLEVINPVGQPFDPEQHEAVSTALAESKEEDHTVAIVFQPGYRFKGVLLRAARVVVKQWNG